jgi:hypothetical protein
VRFYFEFNLCPQATCRDDGEDEEDEDGGGDDL